MAAVAARTAPFPAPLFRRLLFSRSSAKLPKLKEGLRLLCQADPSVEVVVEDSGEHILVTAGELHLEVCDKPPPGSG